MTLRNAVKPAQPSQRYDTPLFRPGRCVATLGLDNLICQGTINPHELLQRHICGDPGELANTKLVMLARDLEEARGQRLSAFLVNSEYVWVVTSADWSVTKLMLPSEWRAEARTA
ncbi:MAG: type I restriction endonuclease subunit M [Comamonas thiooxydans]|jgi:hypothetical protein